MLGDNQEQSAEQGSIAIQAGRDIHYHGPSITEIGALCTLIFRNNFPELREEARRTAEEHVRSFANDLEQRIVNDASSIMLEKFREPDVQAAINDAVQASARKGNAANPEILTKLISERVSTKSSDYKDIVISEAVQVVPRLTAGQISFLSFVHFVKSVNIQGMQNVGQLEAYGQAALRFSSPGFGLSASQRQHIQYSGAASVNGLLSIDLYSSYAIDRYSYLGFQDGEALNTALKAHAPSFAALLDQFVKDDLWRVDLTSVGQAIAIANISSFIGKLDYAVWLQ